MGTLEQAGAVEKKVGTLGAVDVKVANALR